MIAFAFLQPIIILWHAHAKQLPRWKLVLYFLEIEKHPISSYVLCSALFFWWVLYPTQKRD